MKRLKRILSSLHPEIEIDRETRLIEDGILDSLDIVTLVTDLNDEYKISIGAAGRSVPTTTLKNSASTNKRINCKYNAMIIYFSNFIRFEYQKHNKHPIQAKPYTVRP